MELDILVVDDSPTDRRRIIQTLRKRFPNAKTTEASDGDEAIVKLRARSFDVLLTDQHMPRVSGIEVLRQAKELRPETLRLMMTADEDLALVQQALAEGVEGYILKRWSADRIGEAVMSLILGARN